LITRRRRGCGAVVVNLIWGRRSCCRPIIQATQVAQAAPRSNTSTRPLADPTPLPVEHGTFEYFESAFLPPATRVFTTPLDRWRQTRQQIPAHGLKTSTLMAIDDDVADDLMRLPERHLWKAA